MDFCIFNFRQQNLTPGILIIESDFSDRTRQTGKLSRQFK